MFPVINSTSDRNYCGMIDTIASITYQEHTDQRLVLIGTRFRVIGSTGDIDSCGL